MQRQQISRPVSDQSLQIPPCVLHWQGGHRADAPRLRKPPPVAVHRQYAVGEHEETVSLQHGGIFRSHRLQLSGLCLKDE